MAELKKVICDLNDERKRTGMLDDGIRNVNISNDRQLRAGKKQEILMVTRVKTADFAEVEISQHVNKPRLFVTARNEDVNQFESLEV